MTNSSPTFVFMLDRIAGLATDGAAERTAVLASLRWINRDGELWPSLENWAALAGLTPRSLRRVLRRLERRGIVVVVKASAGGTGRTARYRFPALTSSNPHAVSGIGRPQGTARVSTPAATNPDTESALGQPRTRTGATPNPDRRDREPGHRVRPSIHDLPVNGKGDFQRRDPTDEDLAVASGRARP